MKRILALLAFSSVILASCGGKGNETNSGEDDKPVVETGKVTLASGQATTITIPGKGGSATVNFTANKSWRASAADKWLSVSQGSGSSGSVSITVSAEANSVSAVRTTTLTLQCDKSTVALTVNQEAGEIVASAIPVDSPIVLTLESAPELGTSGSIKIFDKSGTEKDVINLADLASVTIREDGQMIPKEQMTEETTRNTMHDVLRSGNRYRTVHYTPLRVEGKTLVIKPHSGALSFGGEYYLTMDAGVIKGHPGITKGELTFKTKTAPASKTLSVNPDGSGDFCTVQGALTYASTLGKSDAVTINLAAGTYREMLFMREKENVTIKGASRETSVIEYANNDSYAFGSGESSSSEPKAGSKIGSKGGRCVALFENCNNLRFESLTVHNSFGSEKGQAECIYFNSGSNSHRLTIEDCALLSLQDTFLCKGEVWVHKSLIAGHCDYIWGYPKACLFEECEIRSEAAGYIVQARVQGASDKGFVFLNCHLTAKSGVKDGSMYLARSGGDTKYYDNVTYINCKMESVIAPVGWYTNPKPNPETPSATSGWKEYGSVDGSGKAISSHNSYGKVLTAAEAAPFMSKQQVLGW